MGHDDSQATESLLDRIGPFVIWIGLVVIMVVAIGVMVEGQAGYGAGGEQVASASHDAHP